MVAVKVIPALLAMAVSGLAAPSDPGETAVDFLEKVRTKNLNLEPGADTALSPQTSDKKRKEIARRLERVARDLGDDRLEVGSVKLDGDLAAVMVRKIGGFDPARLQVFPIALVKRGADWTAAPVPASFENSGVRYATALKNRLESLEDWMLRERVVDLENLREQSTARMRREIEANFPVSTLRGFTSQQAGERFIAACEQRQLPAILALLGGLSATLPEDWPARLRAADMALSSTSESARPWRLLVAPEVLRVPVYHDGEAGETSAIVSIACLDPTGNLPRSKTPKVELVHLALSKKSDGLWRVDPSAEFLTNGSVRNNETDEDLDGDLLELFPAKLALKYPVAPAATVQQACDALIQALGSSNPASWASLIHLQGDPSDQRAICARAAQAWWDLRSPSVARQATPLALHESGNLATAACQLFDARNPDRLDLKFLFFEKTPMGWLWDPSPADTTRAALRDWTDLQSAHWKDQWQDALLRDCTKLEKIPDSAAPGEEESRKLLESWFAATHQGDLAAALRLTARLDTPDSKITLLRNLGFEMTGARLKQDPPSITGVHRGEIWSAVGAEITVDEKSSFPLYPVIGTPAGPRLLLEVDLAASGSRSRDFLNGEALERLAVSNPAAAVELKKHFSAHQAALNPEKKTEPPMGGNTP